MASSSRREKKYRQTYPGPNDDDNEQMLQDIKDTLDHHQRAQVVTAAASTTAGSERERSLVATAGTSAHSSGSGSGGSERESNMRTEYPSGSREAASGRRSSPPSDREHGGAAAVSGSPGASQRVQQNRSTPTKQLGSSDWNKQTMKEIKKQLRPFASSDPGFHPARDRVNKKMLMQLINYGYNEVSYLVEVSRRTPVTVAS